jgi:hypothetical protein
LPEQRHRTVFLIGATLFVIVTDVWRLHVERGQIYVFHLLALSIAIYCSRSGLVDSPAAGVALGALCLLRPNWLVLAPALLVLRQWRCAGSLAATAVVGGALTFAVLPASSWQNYLDVGDQYYRLIQDWESVPDRPAPTDHRWAEGVNFDCALRNVASSSFAIVWRIMHERYGLPMVDLALVSKLMLGGLAVVLLAFLGRRRGESAFALMIVIGMDTEFFLPHRWGYADVMLLAPLALLLPSLMQNPTARGIVVVGLICGTLGQPLIGLQTATILRSWLVMGVLTGLALANIACWKSVEDGKETQA